VNILFGKKKAEEKKEESAPSPDSNTSSGGEPDMNLGSMVAEITKIKASLESFGEIRKANSERFATLNEQIGELRGQIMDVNRNMGTLEVKTTKAADLVESVHPDKLMIQVQKSDGKVEALRGLIESKDAMIQNIMEQLKGMRNQMKVFKGIEEVLKLNEDVKTEVMNVKKMTALVERHADRVENIFVESQRTFKEFNDLLGQVSIMKSQLKETSDKADKLEVKGAKYIETSKFESRMSDIEKLAKRMKELSDESEKNLKGLKNGFNELKGELSGAFDNRIERAETMSNALAQLLKENPMFARGLDLGKYLQMELEAIKAGTSIAASDNSSKKETKAAAESK
jgi:chromosome segregation ATPase